MVESILNFLKDTGFYMLAQDWKSIVMILISCVLCYLAIVKKFEPLLLLPIAIGMLLTNLPGAEMYHSELFAGGHTNWDLFGGADVIRSVDLNKEMLNYFQVYESGDVTVGNYLLGHLSGLSLESNAFFNQLGQVVSATGEVIAEQANIVLDMAGLTVQDGALFMGKNMLATQVTNINAGLLDYLY